MRVNEIPANRALTMFGAGRALRLEVVDGGDQDGRAGIQYRCSGSRPASAQLEDEGHG